MKPPLATNAWLALVLIAASAIAPRAHGTAVGDGLELTIPVPPTPVRVEDHWQLDYEVLLANRSGKRITLEEFVVSDGRDGRPIARLSGQTLDQHAALFGATPAPSSDPKASLAVAGTFVEPGQQVVLFIDASLPGHSRIDSIRHRVSYHIAGASGTSQGTSPPMALPRANPSLLAPPLRGGPWAAIHDADWPRGHRRVFYRVDGHARLPGRFAIDWVKLDERGHFATGDADPAQAWYGYGADVLAVANARVAAVRDGMDEPSRISQRTQHVPEDDAGNYLALQLADGRYAFYEHLRKGSIRVAVGDRVDVGQVIASLGFSGESTGPHLHFHVAGANSPLGGEGMPFEIRRFVRLGHYDDIARLGQPWRPAAGDTTRRNEWPDSNTVVMFADRPAAAEPVE